MLEDHPLPHEPTQAQGQTPQENWRLAIDMPWVLGYELRRLAAWPYIRLMFALHGITWGKRWRVWGMPIIQRYRGSRILLGDGILLRSWPSTNPLTPLHPVVLATRSASAVIEIGEDVGLTGATLVAAERIQIGAQAFIGANAVIVDTDFHPLDPEQRRRDVLGGSHKPVLIGEQAFIGMHAIILKGVHIGAGAVVGAGSVVTEDVPARTIVAGNPARIVRRLDPPEVQI